MTDSNLTLATSGGPLDYADADPRYLIGEIKKLRAILAPLLDEPVQDGEVSNAWCVFCGNHHWVSEKVTHAPGCPVLRKDELLGR